MNKYKIALIIVGILILAGVMVAIVITTTSDDIGSFTVVYSGNAKKYESNIKQGINKWVSIGTGGLTIRITTYLDNSDTVAYVTNQTVYINETVFGPLSNNLKNIAIAHEVGHVLGIGVWGDNFITAGGISYLSNTRYPKTAKAYVDNIRPTGQTVAGPPLAGQGSFGQGSALVHWSPDATYGLQRDLMTPTLSSSADIISIVDLQFLQEAHGIKVDLSKAQPLKFNYYSVVMEYVYGNEETKFCCGSCSEKHDKEE